MYDYSVGDRVHGDDGSNPWDIGTVMYTDPDSGGVVRWLDGEETGFSWEELGTLLPVAA